MAPYHVRLTSLSAKTLANAAIVLCGFAVTVQPAAADGFDTLHVATSVCEEVRTYQTGVADEELNTISIPEGPGPIVAAYATWIGADDLTPNDVTRPGRADSTLTFNGQEVVGVPPSGAAASQDVGNGKYWYGWNADIGPNGANILHGTSKQELSVSGWAVAHEDYAHGRSGLEINIVYDVSPCSEPVDVTILSGVDWIYETADRPRSTSMVLPVMPTSNDRVETVRLSLWGGEKGTDRCRYSALWMLAGSEAPPSDEDLNLFEPTRHQAAFGINNAVEIVANPFIGPDSTCELEINPTPDVAYASDHLYPGGAFTAPYYASDVRRHALPSGAEILSIEVDLHVPAGSSWVALQLESEGEHYGESGSWTANFTTRAAADASSISSSRPIPGVDSAGVPEEAPVPLPAEPEPAPTADSQIVAETDVKGNTVTNDQSGTETPNPATQIESQTETPNPATQIETPNPATQIESQTETPNPASSSSGELAWTGSSTSTLVTLAAVMICAGLLLLRRRRDPQEATDGY